MKLKGLLVAAALPALALFGAATTANAALLTITYSGTVTSLVDPNGLFGSPTTNGSASFTDTFVFDLSKGFRVSGSGYDEILGGSAFGLGSPLVSSTLTINGTQENFPGGYGDGEFYQPGQYVEATSDQYNSGTDGWRYDFIHMLVTNAPSSMDTSFSGTGSGYGWFFSCDPAACNVDTETFGGNFEPTSVVATVGGVPEPATWTMLILGVAMIGYVARRRSLGTMSAIAAA